VRRPKSDLISSLVAAQDRGDLQSDEEIVATCVMMAFAG
jgi:cytochrome P450